MFDGRGPIGLAVTYILCLIVYPFLAGWLARVVSVVALVAGFLAVDGIITSTAFLGIVSGVMATLYMTPATILAAFSIAELAGGIRAKRSRT